MQPSQDRNGYDGARPLDPGIVQVDFRITFRKRQPYVAGDDFSLADIAATPYIWRLTKRVNTYTDHAPNDFARLPCRTFRSSRRHVLTFVHSRELNHLVQEKVTCDTGTIMTITRVPSLAHWGAFNALVEGGRVVGCQPFAHDPAPSPMLAAIPDIVHSPLRVGRPAIRNGWLEGRPRTGADGFHYVSWDEALDRRRAHP